MTSLEITRRDWEAGRHTLAPVELTFMEVAFNKKRGKRDADVLIYRDGMIERRLLERVWIAAGRRAA